MAITCRRCGAEFDVTLFQFEHRVRCDCGAWVELASGHVRDQRTSGPGDLPMNVQDDSPVAGSDDPPDDARHLMR